jgi:gliding motility-associated-like protein
MTDPERMTVVISTTCDNGEADGTALAQLDGGTGPYQFTWSNGDTAQFITDLTAGTYFVEVVDANGCQATDIDGGFVCPNFGCFEARTVITPDGDGRNEEFIIGCTSRFPNNKLEIFNRWGQLVFETDDYVCEEASLDGCWLGTNARGEDLPEGVYFYIFDYTDPVTNEEDQKRGSVTVLRQ